MIIDKLTVEVSPFDGFDRAVQLRIEVRSSRGQIIAVQRVEAQDHINSVFDLMVECAVNQLKEHLKKVTR